MLWFAIIIGTCFAAEFPDIPALDPDELPPHEIVPAGYLPVDVCTDISGGNDRFAQGTFKVTRVEVARGYKWHGGGAPSHYHEYWHRGRVSYQVTCGNGITYTGRKTFRGDSYTCNESAETPWDQCSEGARDWEAVNISEFNVATGEVGDYNYELKFPYKSVLESWDGRKVYIPKYFGGKNKLAVPTILVNGLGFDYTSWGVKPAGVRGSESWNQGLVSDYNYGSLPDVISRSYGLSKGSDINNNGIYFLNLDAEILLTNQTNAVNGVLTRLGEMMLNHVSISNILTPELQVDIVCHSTGCLIVRKAIELSSAYSSPIPGFNPVNHIRRIITVDAPHTGSALAKPASVLVGQPEFNGLSQLFLHLDAAGIDEMTGEPKVKPSNQDKVLETTVELDYSTIMYESAEGFFASGVAWFEGQLVDIVSTVAGVFGYGFDTFHVVLTGGLFGPHTATVNADKKLQNLIHKETYALTGVGSQIQGIRKQLFDIQSSWLNTMSTDYPRKPNGEYIDLYPYYSDNIAGIEKELVRKLVGGTFEALCVGNSSPNCADIQEIAERTLTKSIENYLATEDVSVGIEPWFGQLLTDMRSGWLANSDLIVEKSSQIWGLAEEGRDASGTLISQLHRAQPFSVHYSEYPLGHPARPVVHGALSKAGGGNGIASLKDFQFAKSGSPEMGRDLFCALEAGCSVMLSQGSDVIYFGPAVEQRMLPPPPAVYPGLTKSASLVEGGDVWTQSIDLVGSFSVYLENLSSQYSGFIIQNMAGESIWGFIYDQDYGTYVISSATANETKLIAPPERRPQFSVARVNSTIFASVTIAGEPPHLFRMSTSVEDEQLKIVAVGSDLNSEHAILRGKASLANPASQQLAVANYGGVEVILQEKGGTSLQDSRPWMWVTNATDSDLHGITMSYYFDADPVRIPQANADFPAGVGYELIQVSGHLWKLVVQLPTIPARGAVPGQSGYQFRLHYQDWSNWITADDYSHGLNLPFSSNKVVLKDASGRVIWGIEPSIDEYKSDDVIVTNPITLSLGFSDGGTNEANMIRPRVTLKHNGGPALEPGYQVLLLIPAVGGASDLPQLSDWWSPSCSGTIERAGASDVLVRWTFDTRLVGGQEVSIGEWGIHWTDYRTISKVGLQPLQMVVLDAQGNAVLGKMPEIPSGDFGNLQLASQIQALFTDAGVNEANMIRPRITVQNHGPVVLEQGFRLSLYMRGFTSLPILEKWYSPNYSANIVLQGNGLLRVDFVYTGFGITTGERVELGEWGIHLDGHTTLDKSEISQSVVVIHDVQGRRLFGTIPD